MLGKMKRLGALAVLLVTTSLTVAACGSSDSTTETAAAGGADGEATAIKTALVLNGKADDQSWNTSMTDSIERVKSEAGLDIVNTLESVAPADGARAVRELIEQGGAQMVISHASALDQATKEVAAEHPEVCFIQAFGQGDPGANMTHYADDATGANYLAGMAAASQSKSGTIGTVGGVDLDEIKAGAKAFESGARAINPNVKTLLTWVGDFEDPLKGKEAGIAQISQGADVVFALGDGTGLGTVEAAKAKNVKIIGAWFDQEKLAPDLMITGFVTDWAPLVKDVAAKFRADGADNCGKGKYVAALDNKGMLLAPFHAFDEKIPADVKQQISDAEDAIVNGTLDPVTGKKK
ncbi:MAG: BMP family protein [Solirubrobacteraceae bacterium]|nr:BMP family protein [Solirubrobacteraceae bacterium]